MRVLLTEDDIRLADAIRRGLRGAGIEIALAATGDRILLGTTFLPEGHGAYALSWSTVLH